MIFKTFENNDIDKWTAKIGLFGKSFNDVIDSINKRKLDIDNLMSSGLVSSYSDAKKQVGGLFSYLYPKKDIKSQLIDVDSVFPKIDTTNVKEVKAEIVDLSKLVANNETTWQELFDTLSDEKKHFAELGQQMEGQIITEEGLISANEKARASAIAHNNALKQQTLGAKAANVALKGLALAGNMVAAWAITEVIQLVVKGLDELVNSVDNCKERVDNLMSSYQSALDTANSNASRVEKLASDYEKLSKGVNNLGGNVSLTSEEYEQYNSLVSEIADMFPTLIQGYDDQGTAILNLKGNVEGLRDAYKEAQTEAYNMLITSGEDNDGNDIIKQWEDIHDPGFFAGLLDLGAADVGGNISVSDALAQLKEIQKLTAEEYRNIENITSAGSYKEIEGLTDIQKDIGYGSYIYKALGIDGYVTDKEFEAAKKQAKVLVQTYNAEIESALSDIETLANAYLMTNDDYSKLTDNSKTAASLLVNNLTEDIANDFSSKEDVGAWVDSVVSKLQGDSKLSNAINGLFTTDLSNMSVDNAKAVVDQYINTIAKILNEDPVELKVRLGFDDYNDDDIAPLKTKVQGFLKDEFDDKVGELSLDDLQIASNLEIPEGTLLSWDELIEKIKESKEQNAKISIDIDDLTKKIDEIQNAYKTLRDAIKEYNKEGYISVDTFQSIIGLGAEYLKYLVDENGNLRLDEQALKNVTIARINDMVVAQKNSILDTAEKWTNEADALKYLKDNLDDASKSYDEILNKRIQALRLKWTEQTDENGNRVWTDEQIENSIAGITKQFNSLDGIGNSAINGIKSGLGMTGESAKDNADKIKDIKKELDDLAKSEALDKLKYKFDKIEQSISKIDTALSLLNDIDGLTYEDDYIGKIEIASEQMELAQNKAKALAQEFNELSSQEYNSGSQASELANRMKSTADSINENQKQIIEYGKNITSYYMSALKSINSMSTATLNRATSLIERNIKTLSEGGLTGLEFSFSPNIPQSAIEKQRRENQSLLQEMQNYYAATAEMQKNALDLEFQEQVADNARKKEELLKQLAEQQTAINDYFVSVKTEQQTFNTETTSALNNDLTTKTNAINSALSTIKESVSETINWLKSNPISITTSSNDKLIDIGPYSGAGSQQSVISAIKGASLATEAAKYIGTPYVWGGTDLSKGVDCSGFVQTLLKNQGVNVQRTAASQFNDKETGVKITNFDDLQVGDVIYFRDNNPDTVSHNIVHTGIYIGNGEMINAQSNGVSKDKLKKVGDNWMFGNEVFAGGKRYFATGTHNYGIAGENYKLEWAVDKKTGQWFKIESPTVFDRDKYDIIGEKTSKEIDKPLPMFATGTPISDPKVREMVKKASESTGVPANIILSVIDQESGNTWVGKVKDSNGYSYGYMQLYDKGSLTEVPQNSRLAAMNDPETNILWGAKYLKKMHDAVGGNWADAASAYNQGLGNFKKNGRNAYGDEVYNRATSSAFVEAAKQIGATTPLISTIATNTSNTASSTSLIAKKDFKSELREIIAGNNPQATGSEDSKVSEGLLSFIQEKMKEQEFNDQDFINKFEAMAQYNEDAKTVFADYEKKLSEARGTDNYEQIRGEISTQAGEYVKSLIGIQANMTAEKAAQDYNTAKTVQEYTLEYYLKRKNDKTNPANATELKQIIERYSEVTEDLESYSDTYVSTIKSHTDYLVSTLGNNLKEYDDQLTWQDNLSEGLERKIKLTSNLNEQRDLRNELLDSEWNKMSIYDNQKTDAHQAVLKLRADDSYAPVFKKLAELGISIEDWFDAQGNTSAQFEKDKTQFSINAPELVPVINQIAEVIKTAKQQWYNANQQQEGIFENIKSTLQENFEKDREPIQSDIEISQWISNMFSDKSFALKNTEYMKQLGSEFNLLNELIREKKELDALYKAGKIRAADYTEQVKNLDSEIRNNLSDVKSLLQTIYQNQLDDIEEKINEIQDDSSKITDEIQYQINKLEDEKDLLQEQADKWQSAVNAVKKVISDQLDALNDEKDSAADYWQDQIDAVQKLNDETNRNIELNKTKKDLEKAESQKVSLIYKDGKLVYMANQADVDEARQNYSDKVREIDQEKAIEILEEQRDLQAKNYEDKIKQLEDYQKKWEEVLDKYSNYVDETNAEELLGYNFREDIANKDLGLLDITSDAYYKLESQIEGYLQKRIDKLNKEIKVQENATNETVRNLNKQKDAIEDTEVEWNKLYDTIVTMFKEGKTTSIPGIIQNFCEKFGTYFDKLDATGLGEAIVDVVNKQLGVVGNTSNNTSNSTNNVDSTVYKDYSAANSFKDGINALDKERDSGKITKDEYNIKLGELANKLGAVWESGSDGGFNVGGYKVNYDKGIWDIVGNDNIDNNLNSDTSTTNKNNSNHDTDGLVNTDKNGNLTQSKSDEEKRAEAIQKAKDSLSDWKKANKTRGCDNKEVYDSVPEAFAALKGNMTGNLLSYGFIYKVGDSYRTAYFSKGNGSLSTGIDVFNAYRKGTDSAKSGYALINEPINNNGNLNGEIVNFRGGEQVIDADKSIKLINGLRELTDDGSPLYKALTGSLTEIGVPDLRPKSLFDGVNPLDIKRNTVNTDNSVHIDQIVMNEVDNVRDFTRQLQRELPSVMSQINRLK